MTAIIACALAAMVLALLQRPPPVLSATLSLTFNRCAITWSDVQQVNATIQCRRSELSARMHNFHVLDGLWVNITASSQPIGRHGDELSYSTVASADLDICEFIDGAGSGHGFYAEIFRSLQRQPEHHLIDQCPVQPVRERRFCCVEFYATDVFSGCLLFG